MPLCAMCGEMRARRLSPRSRDGRSYVFMPADAIFCSQKCAAIHGLLYFPRDEQHWCPSSGAWECESRDDCAACSQASE